MDTSVRQNPVVTVEDIRKIALEKLGHAMKAKVHGEKVSRTFSGSCKAEGPA